MIEYPCFATVDKFSRENVIRCQKDVTRYHRAPRFIAVPHHRLIQTWLPIGALGRV